MRQIRFEIILRLDDVTEDDEVARIEARIRHFAKGLLILTTESFDVIRLHDVNIDED